MVSFLHVSEGIMIIAIDFDGVIAEWTGKFKGHGVFGKLIPGAQEAITHLKNVGHTIIIYTCRIEIHQIREFLVENKIPFDYINHCPFNVDYPLHPAKPYADVYVDDSGLNFDGFWPDMVDKIQNFKKWWQK